MGTVRRRASPDLRRRPPVAGTPLLSCAVEGNKRYHAIDMHRIVMHRIVGRIRELRRLRRVYTDRLLTLLTVVLMLAMFVFAPLQAVGIFVFQGFAIAALLAIIGSMF